MRMVLLRHELPDGTGHFDWMIETENAAEGLVSFRVWDRIDQPGLGVFRALRVADHRSAYLDFQGPVSAGRGSVSRVATGIVESIEDNGTSIRVQGSFPGLDATWTGRRIDGDWAFAVLEPE